MKPIPRQNMYDEEKRCQHCLESYRARKVLTADNLSKSQIPAKYIEPSPCICPLSNQ